MRILIVEDERKIARFIERGLREEHYAVDVAFDGENGRSLAELNPYDLIVLDVMLPDEDGMQLCRELRVKHVDAPILMLTARDRVLDKVRGLDSGADDYLTKPFAFEELLARVRALLRRRASGKPAALAVADLELDQITHQVTRGGKEIALTGREYTLLEYLMLNANRVVTRTMLYQHVWDINYDTYTNVVDVFVNYLRNKIDRGFEKKLIHTIRGVGYMMRE
jgi:heavy metal response regulator